MSKVKLLGSIIVAGLVVSFVSGCGTAVVITNTPAPAVVQLDQVIEFTRYVDPAGQYALAVPQQAKISRSADNLQTTFEYEDPRLIYGRYVIELDLVSVAKDESPAQLMTTLIASRQAPSPISEVTADGKQISGAAGSYEVSGDEPCPSLRVAVAAFVKAERGYILQIRSDAPNRCDASKLPETAAVFDSLQLP